MPKEVFPLKDKDKLKRLEIKSTDKKYFSKINIGNQMETKLFYDEIKDQFDSLHTNFYDE